MTESGVMMKLFEFAGALAVCTGCLAWWRKGTKDEDEMVATAAETVLEAVSDSDCVRKIDCITGKNLRDQVTIEEAIEMGKEKELRRWPWRN